MHRRSNIDDICEVISSTPNFARSSMAWGRGSGASPSDIMSDKLCIAEADISKWETSLSCDLSDCCEGCTTLSACLTHHCVRSRWWCDVECEASVFRFIVCQTITTEGLVESTCITLEPKMATDTADPDICPTNVLCSWAETPNNWFNMIRWID